MSFKFIFEQPSAGYKKVAFLDRDGVINYDHGYVFRRSDFEFLPGVFKATRLLVLKGYKIVIITNQSGIGRGMFSIEDFEKLTFWMQAKFLSHGASILGLYFCPHHPTEAIEVFRIKCDCRKPGSKMILDAVNDLQIDLDSSIIVGDKNSDLVCGYNAGIRNLYLVKKNGIEQWSSTEIACTKTTDLLSVAEKL